MIRGLFIFALALLPACDFFMSADERLYEARTERREILDTLYAEFGGSDLAGAAEQAVVESNAALNAAHNEANRQGSARPSSEVEFAQALMNTVTGVVEESDRAVFEQHCMVSGIGERPPALTGRYQAFFARSDVKRQCRRAYLLSVEIEELYAEIATAQGSR